jgi:hypothetical protein
MDRQALASVVPKLSKVRKTKDWVSMSFENVAKFKYLRTQIKTV